MKKEAVKLFEEHKVRSVWDDQNEKWYFSIVDVVAILTDAKDFLTARKYWNKLKERLKKEGNETVSNCHQLKLQAADDKMRLPRPQPYLRPLVQVTVDICPIINDTRQNVYLTLPKKFKQDTLTNLESE